MSRAPSLLKEIIELLPKRIFIVLRFPEFAVLKLEIITEIASIFIQHPFRLRLAALVVIIEAVMAAVETAAKIRLAKWADVLPSYYLGYVDLLPTLIAYSHVVIRSWLELAWPGAAPEPVLLTLE